jgi:hypothetical protein
MYTVCRDEFTYAEMKIPFPLKVLIGSILAAVRYVPYRAYEFTVVADERSQLLKFL